MDRIKDVEMGDSKYIHTISKEFMQSYQYMYLVVLFLVLV